MEDLRVTDDGSETCAANKAEFTAFVEEVRVAVPQVYVEGWQEHSGVDRDYPPGLMPHLDVHAPADSPADSYPQEARAHTRFFLPERAGRYAERRAADVQKIVRRIRMAFGLLGPS